jgi:hypothetical protein
MQSINQSDIIAGFNAAQNAGGNLTITPAQFFDIRNTIQSQMIAFGEITALVGFVIGIWVGWSWARGKYDKPKQ